MEIEYKLNLDLDQINKLDHHSVLNILNVAVYEMMVLSEILKDPDQIEPVLEEVYKSAKAIKDGTFNFTDLGDLGALRDQILDGIETLAKASNVEECDTYSNSYFNLRGLFEILEVRVGEMSSRSENPTAWECFSCNKLRQNFVDVYDAISRNSKGAYRFVYNREERQANDYFLNLEISGSEDGVLFMPPVFQDVIRDLAANSRKYTAPGGDLIVWVKEKDGILRADISDNGIGIPMDEVPDIFRFGYRATNAKGKRTMGGGFGLTKAYYMVCLYNGKMWIDSNHIGKDTGTTIRFEVPVPTFDRAANSHEGALVIPT